MMSLLSAGGDSSQDEAEEEAKAITVKTCAHIHSHKLMIALTLCPHVKPSYLNFSARFSPGEVCSSRVGAGPAEEDPVVRIPPEEAGRRALGSPALPRSQGKGRTHH